MAHVKWLDQAEYIKGVFPSWRITFWWIEWWPYVIGHQSIHLWESQAPQLQWSPAPLKWMVWSYDVSQWRFRGLPNTEVGSPWCSHTGDWSSGAHAQPPLHLLQGHLLGDNMGSIVTAGGQSWSASYPLSYRERITCLVGTTTSTYKVTCNIFVLKPGFESFHFFWLHRKLTPTPQLRFNL